MGLPKNYLIWQPQHRKAQAGAQNAALSELGSAPRDQSVKLWRLSCWGR